MIVRVGDYVRHNGGRWVARVFSVWTIDRGPNLGRVKASAVTFTSGPRYRGWDSTTIDVAESFEPFPYAGPEIPIPFEMETVRP